MGVRYEAFEGMGNLIALEWWIFSICKSDVLIDTSGKYNSQQHPIIPSIII